MIRLGKKAAVLTAVGLITASGLAGCSSSVDPDDVAAVVGDDEITMGVANFYARMVQGQYETYYASMMGTTAEEMWTQNYGGDETYEETMKDSIMESLETMYLLSQHAEEYEVSLTEDEEKAIEEAAAAFDADNTEEAKEYVSGYKKSIEEYLRLNTIQTKMQSRMKEGVDENVSDEEAAQKSMQYVYFSYTSTDESGNTVDLSDEEKENLKTAAQSLKDRTVNGEDFAAVASELGYEASTQTFDSESTALNADFITAANALENEGDVTDPVETDSGIYVGKLTSLLDREATDAKKTDIIEERKQEQYQNLLDGWRDETKIEVNEKVWGKVDFEDLGITIITTEDSSDSSDTAE